MHIPIIGAAGMVGRKLTAGLAKVGRLGSKDIVKLTLADVIKPETLLYAGTVGIIATDLSAPVRLATDALGSRLIGHGGRRNQSVATRHR